MNAREEARRLYLEEHLPPAEIARKLGIKHNTVKQWRNRDGWSRAQGTGTEGTGTVGKQVQIESVGDQLTDAQETFCQAFIRTFNASAAYRASHPESTHRSAWSNGYRMLQNERIRARIEQLKAEKVRALMVSQDDVIELYMRIAFADLGQFADWQGGSLHLLSSSSVDGQIVKKVAETKDGISIELVDKQKALDFLAQYFLMNPLDRHKVDFDKRRLEIEERKVEAETPAANGGIRIPDAIWRNLMNPVYRPLLDDQRPLQIIFGGSSSGKSFDIGAQRTLRDIMTGRHNYLILRKTRISAKDTIWNELNSRIADLDLESEFDVNKSELVIEHRATGRTIKIMGLDNPEKIKSYKPRVGILTTVLVEEATDTERNDFKQLTKRLRGIEAASEALGLEQIDADPVVKRIVLLFNPILQDHWIYADNFAGRWDDSKRFYADEKLVILKTTYKDNLAHLTPDDIARLEDETDKYYHDVYTLGNWGVLGNLIFTNWEVRDFTKEAEEQANDAGLLGEARQRFITGWLNPDKPLNGLDFGFSPDPNAYVRVGYRSGEIRVYQEAGGLGQTNDVLAAMLKPIIGRETVYCDNDPLRVQEINNMGVNAVFALKGPGSVEFGIQFIQRHRLIVDNSCAELISELRQYKYLEDRRTGQVLPEPVDKNNHWIDALRYALTEKMLDAKVV